MDSGLYQTLAPHRRASTQIYIYISVLTSQPRSFLGHQESAKPPPCGCCLPCPSMINFLSSELCCAGPLLPLPGTKQGLHITSCVFLVSGISNAEARQPGKAPNFSVNWTVGDATIEVINATTGKDELGRPSRLCKHALYCRWMRVHGKVLRHPHRVSALLHPFHPSWFPPSCLHCNLLIRSCQKESYFFRLLLA